MISGANFLLDVIPYRHSEAAQILGGRCTALCQAVALTSENDFGTLYRPGCALPGAASPHQCPALRATTKMPPLTRDRLVIFPRLLVNDDEVSLLLATLIRDQLHRWFAHEPLAMKTPSPGQGRDVPVLVKRVRAVAGV